MKQSGKIAALLVTGAFLWAGAAVADPDRYSDRDRRHEKNYRDHRDTRNDRFHDNRREWHRDNDRERYTYNRYRDWDRERDYYRNRTNIELRISTYPTYPDRYRRYPVRNATPYWLWNNGYRPYYYRDYRLITYPYRTQDHIPAGNQIYWIDENAAGPQQTSQTNDGRYCREYYRDANVNGQMQQVYGTACMQPDGSWQILN